MEWQPSAGTTRATGYELRGGEDVIRTEATRARVDRLAPLRQSCFTVTALGPGGLRSGQTEPFCLNMPPDSTPPTAPAGVTARAERGGVGLKWSPATDDFGVAGYEIVRDGRVVASGPLAEGRETGLPPREHCFTVRALDAAGNRSPPSPPACATPPDTTPPSAPSGVAATPRSESEVEVAWKPSTDDVGVTGYEVLRDGKPVASLPVPPAREAGLTAAVHVCYSVVALDAAGNRSQPSQPACATTLDQTPPRPPASVTATLNGDQSIDLQWPPATDNVGVTSYEVWRDSQMVTRLGTANSYRDAAQRTSAETCFAVRALDAAGNVSPPSPPACVRTPDVTPPTMPSRVVATAASPTRILLSWERSTDGFGVVGYEVTRDGALVASVKAPPAEESSLKEPGRYCYSVVALDAAGNRSAASAPACAQTADPSLPVPPSNLVAVRSGADEFELRWEASPTKGVTYEVLWDGARKVPGMPQAGSKILGKTPLTRLKVFGLAARERHCYTVVARRDAQVSPETLPVCASVSVAADAR